MKDNLHERLLLDFISGCVQGVELGGIASPARGLMQGMIDERMKPLQPAEQPITGMTTPVIANKTVNQSEALRPGNPAMDNPFGHQLQSGTHRDQALQSQQEAR